MCVTYVTTQDHTQKILFDRSERGGEGEADSLLIGKPGWGSIPGPEIMT